MLLVATARSGVHAWDLRNHKPAFSLSATPQHVRSFHILVACNPLLEAIVCCYCSLQLLKSLLHIIAGHIKH